MPTHASEDRRQAHAHLLVLRECVPRAVCARAALVCVSVCPCAHRACKPDMLQQGKSLEMANLSHAMARITNQGLLPKAKVRPMYCTCIPVSPSPCMHCVAWGLLASAHA